MTLFSLARPDVSAFREALERHFGGVMDKGTLEKVAISD
jgi:uncharacterized protein (DUF1810 family)